MKSELVKEFEKHIKQIIKRDELQFFCKICLYEMGVDKPEPTYENAGKCDLCEKTDEVSNPHLNLWLQKRQLTLDPKKENSGHELKKLILWSWLLKIH